MALTLRDGIMTSDRTTHTARLAPGEEHMWEVSWLPGRHLRRNDAITAMVLADVAGPGDLHAGHRLVGPRRRLGRRTQHDRTRRPRPDRRPAWLDGRREERGAGRPRGGRMRTPHPRRSPGSDSALPGAGSPVPSEGDGPEPSPPAERLAYSVDEAARLAGLSRDLLYDEMRRGNLDYIKVGRRRLITRQHLERFLGITPRPEPSPAPASRRGS
jgi:excisionase family DNA binding protein